jgi:cytochrome oxidase Cu insertion factor (SCO1/SenC/PrrC family)
MLLLRHGPLSVVLLAASAFLLTFGPVRPGHAQLAVGATAPNFSLVDTQGATQSLAAYADQVRVLFFVGYG